MRKTWLVAVALLGIAQAEAAEIVYRDPPAAEISSLTLTGTPESQPDIFGTGRSYGTDLRYDLGGGFRAEFESLYSYSNHSGLSQGFGGVNSSSMMLRGLYEFDGGSWRVKPFIGAGVGMVNVNAGLLGNESSDWVQAYQVRGGVNYAISQKLMGSIGYNWVKGQKPTLLVKGIPAKIEFPSGGVFLGLNYKLR